MSPISFDRSLKGQHTMIGIHTLHACRMLNGMKLELTRTSENKGLYILADPMVFAQVRSVKIDESLWIHVRLSDEIEFVSRVDSDCRIRTSTLIFCSLNGLPKDHVGVLIPDDTDAPNGAPCRCEVAVTAYT
jgi:hypothetical protein